MLLGVRQAHNAVDLIADVAEAARLRAVAIHGEIFASERLLHEVGDDAPVVDLHARAISVKDAYDARIQLLIAVVGHGRGLGKALGLVVNRAWADRVHIAPIAFSLGMLERVAVTLRR